MNKESSRNMFPFTMISILAMLLYGGISIFTPLVFNIVLFIGIPIFVLIMEACMLYISRWFS